MQLKFEKRQKTAIVRPRAVDRAVRQKTGLRLSESAVEYLTEVLNESLDSELNTLIEQAEKMARYTGRKTIKAKDIKAALA